MEYIEKNTYFSDTPWQYNPEQYCPQSVSSGKKNLANENEQNRFLTLRPVEILRFNGVYRKNAYFYTKVEQASN